MREEGGAGLDRTVVRDRVEVVAPREILHGGAGGRRVSHRLTYCSVPLCFVVNSTARTGEAAGL